MRRARRDDPRRRARPVRTPGSTGGPTATATASASAPAGPVRYTCRSFTSWREAQTFYLDDALKHIRLDDDRDGVACEDYFDRDGRPRFKGPELDRRWDWWHHRRHTVSRRDHDGRDGRDGEDGKDGDDGEDGRTVIVRDYVSRYLDTGGDPARAEPGQQVAVWPSGSVDTGSAA